MNEKLSREELLEIMDNVELSYRDILQITSRQKQLSGNPYWIKTENLYVHGLQGLEQIKSLIENYEFIKNERDYLKGIVTKYQEIVGKVVIKSGETESE